MDELTRRQVLLQEVFVLERQIYKPIEQTQGSRYAGRPQVLVRRVDDVDLGCGNGLERSVEGHLDQLQVLVREEVQELVKEVLLN